MKNVNIFQINENILNKKQLTMIYILKINVDNRLDLIIFVTLKSTRDDYIFNKI